MKQILIVMDYFIPSRKAGGAVKSVTNIIEELYSDFRFVILTRDHDIDGSKYDSIESGFLYQREKYDIIYYKEREFNAKNIFKIAQDKNVSLIYLNSFFSSITVRIIIFSAFYRIGQKYKVILAPRGEFSAGALNIKNLKKRLYLRVFKWLMLSKQIDSFHVSNNHELQDLEKIFKFHNFIIASDIPDKIKVHQGINPVDRKPFVFISRIVKKKNLLFIIESLQNMTEEISLDIYGPLEDAEYWNQCLDAIALLPENIKVKYIRDLDPEEVQHVFSEYRTFIFPTMGENYGHVIIEAMAAGCIVLLSDQTPWKDIEDRKIGYICRLDVSNELASAIKNVLSLDDSDILEYSRRSKQYAEEVTSSFESVEQSRKIFE